MQIEKEHFEAWLFSRPKEEIFNYTSGCNCLIARFLKSKCSLPIAVSAVYYKIGDMKYDLPRWLYEFMRDVLHRSPSCPIVRMGIVHETYESIYGPVTFEQGGDCSEQRPNNNQRETYGKENTKIKETNEVFQEEVV